MTKRITHFLFALGLISTILSCSEDSVTPEQEPPVAIITKPVANHVFSRASSTIMLTADFESDAGLKECTVYLREASALKGWDDPWLPEETHPLEGNKDRIENQFLFQPTIPYDIKNGEYVLVLLVVDVNLNYTSYEIPIAIK